MQSRLVSLLVLLSVSSLALGDDGPTVKLGNGGTLRGVYQSTINGKKVAAFLGVPYAKPPQRFKPAEPPVQWEGVLEAVEEKPDCLQFSELTLKVHGSEDCLYANIFTPQEVSDSTKLDVVIYIHGGGFSFMLGHYGPKYLLEQNVVYVTFKYRVGPLGFLSTGDEVLPGNLGLKDQNMLLRWVQDNIRFFGGNPERVLLTGTSAGGASVHYHMLSPLSKGLFHRAFSMSGSALCCWTQTENAKEKAVQLAQNLGCSTESSEELIDCLQAKDASDIVNQMPKFQKWGYYPFTPFGPVVEPYSKLAFIHEYPSEVIRSGQAADIPWIASLTTEEGLYPVADFVANKTLLKYLDKNLKDMLPSLLDYESTTTIYSKDKTSQKIKEKYLGRSSVDKNIPGLIQMCSDRLFVEGVVKAAQLHAEYYKSPVYSYVFSYRGKHSCSEVVSGSNENFGVSHGDDTAYIFQNEIMNAEDSEEDKKMISLMTEFVATFAATGKPTLRGFRKWPEVCAHDDFTYVNIKGPKTFEIVSNPTLGQPDFWNSLKLAEDS